MSIAFEDRRVTDTTEIYSSELQAIPRNAFSADVVDKLLERLSTDDDFRDLFQSDPRAALHQVGHETPEAERGLRGVDPVMCMVLNKGLASKQVIRAGRERIRASLVSAGVHHIFMMSEG